ncbi:MAG: hypothetical protein CL610_23025 [Anaerolineaceae bacterium]|nr:hypothetical protein [Anaerolineaceae bacterium]
MNILLRPATPDDYDLLATMNRELMMDEGSRDVMSVPDLAERMRRWLKQGWSALLVLMNKVVIGYILYQQRPDSTHTDQLEVYVRHYFIRSVFRGKGLGAAAFERIQTEYVPAGATIVLDVLATNPGARRFWEKMGFQVQADNLRLEKRMGS